MTGTTRLIAAAMLGGLGLLGSTADLFAQAPALHAGGHVAASAAGAIVGVVHDESGAPVGGAMVSAIGATTAFAISDRAGRFQFDTVSPGPYLVRAHLSGFAAPRGQVVEVRAGARASSSIALSRVPPVYPVLEAGLGLPMSPPADEDGAEAAAAAPTAAGRDASASTPDDHSETAWRLRHGRRSVLKDATVPVAVLAADSPSDAGFPELHRFFGDTARLATHFFTDTPFSGRFNLLTTGSFDTPQQLFNSESFSRSVTDVWVSAPAAGQAGRRPHTRPHTRR